MQAGHSAATSLPSSMVTSATTFAKYSAGAMAAQRSLNRLIPVACFWQCVRHHAAVRNSLISVALPNLYEERARYNRMISSDDGDGIVVTSGRRATDIHQVAKDVYAQMLNTGKVVDNACWTHSSLNHLHEVKSLLKVKTEGDERKT